MERIQFRVLGPLEVTGVPLGGLTQRAFLAFLLLHANRVVSIAQVVDAVWGEQPPSSAKNMLHNAAWRLRKLLSGAELASQKPGYVLRIDPAALDLYHFQRRIEQARATADAETATTLFREGLALWRGPALADLTGHDWPIVTALEESRLSAWEDCFEAELTQGRHREVIGELTELLEHEPLRERLCGQLMVALYRAGRQAEALAAYRKARTVFRAELGIEPCLELRRLEQAILNQDVALERPRPVEQAERRLDPVPARPWPGEEAAVSLVGRGRELATLRDALDDTLRTRRPHLVTLLGTAGIGKSRLVGELVGLAEDRPEPLHTLVGRTPAFGRDTAFTGLSAIVQSCTGILGTDPVGVAEDKLVQAVYRVVPDPEKARWILGHLRPLAGLGHLVPERPGTEESRVAWAAFLEEVASERPLVAVLEDLQWADDLLLDFLDELPGRLGPVPLLLVVTARPELLERRPDWGGGKRDASTITLQPLSEPETAGLLHALFRGHGLTDRLPGTPGREPAVVASAEFWHALVTSVGGNPLFAEEYVRMVKDHPRPGSELPLPESVQSVITARIDALPPDEQAVLQDAAVLGTTLWTGPVAELSGRPREAVQDAIDRLVRREILQRSRQSTVAGETEYGFAHILIREIAYARIPVLVRAEQHRRAAAWIETLPVGHAELLAHHYREAVMLTAAAGKPTAELAGRARVVLTETARHATTLGAHKAAARCHKAALELCPPHDPCRPEILLRYGKSLAAWNGSGVEVLTEARDALLLGGEVAAAASAELDLAMLADRRAGHLTSKAGRERVLTLIRHAPPSETLVEMQCVLAISLVVDGRCAEAGELAERALLAAERFSRPDLVVDALKARGAARVDLGEPGGLADFERAVETCAQHGISPTRTLGNLGCALARSGRLGRLPETRTQALEAAVRYGDAVALRMLRGREVVERYWAGEWAEAESLADRMLRTVEPDWLPMRSSWHTVRGRIALSRDDEALAGREAELGLDVARQLDDAQDLCPALAFSARIALLRGERDEAAALVEELLAQARGKTLLPDIGIDLPIVLAELGHDGSVLDDVRESPWRAAALAYVSGREAVAADCYRRIGSRPDEMQARA